MPQKGARRKAGHISDLIAGTSLDIVKSKKVPTDNTTGYKGVYLIKGKYVAKIVFQKKQYYLGTFDQIEDAVQARKEAEEILFDGFAAYYEKYKEKAAADAVWEKEHPISVYVEKNTNNAISVSFLPVMQ